MPYYFSPVGNDQQTDANGNPFVGGKIFTYLAGTSTPASTYIDATTGGSQTNPIILNSLGLSASPIWMLGGQALKFVIQDSAGVTIRTIDGVSGINDVAIVTGTSEWTVSGFAVTYISATSFSVAGDKTGILQVGRRLQTANSGGIAYSSITANSYSLGTTTVVVANDSIPLDAGLSSLSYALLSATNPSVGTAVTAPAGDNSTRVATTAFAAAAIGSRAGEVCFFAMSTAPAGFLKANGALVSRTTYAALFAAIGTVYGVGDGSTTFGLPDLRGEFVRGWDDARGVDSGRAIGTAQTDAIQSHKHGIDNTANIGGGGAAPNILGSGSAVVSTSAPTVDGANGTPRTAAETRPRNIALLACIKV